MPGLIDIPAPAELDGFESRLRTLSGDASIKVDWARGGGVRISVHKGLLKFDMPSRSLRAMLTLLERGRRPNTPRTDDQPLNDVSKI